MKYPFTMLSHCLIFHADETSNESPTCPCPLLEMQLQNQTPESSRHRTEPQRRIRIPRQDRPAHSSRLTSKRQDEHRRYIRRLSTPDLTNTRIPTRPGPLPHRRRIVISPTPDVEILERPSSLERQPPSKVPPEPTFPSPIQTPAPTEESELIIIDETLEEAPPSPSLPDVPASTGPDEDAISIAGSASSIGTQAGSSTQSESGTPKNRIAGMQ